jgi:putative hemolysin
LKRQSLLYTLAVLVIVVFVAVAGPSIVASLSPSPTPQPSVGGGGASMANPASVYCTERGYTLEIRDGQAGQTGICVFPDKSECDEWAFFRGQCGVKWQTPQTPTK